MGARTMSKVIQLVGFRTDAPEEWTMGDGGGFNGAPDGEDSNEEETRHIVIFQKDNGELVELCVPVEWDSMDTRLDHDSATQKEIKSIPVTCSRRTDIYVYEEDYHAFVEYVMSPNKKLYSRKVLNDTHGNPVLNATATDFGVDKC